MIEGFRFLGIEKDPDYAEIARVRIDHATHHPEDFVPKDPEPDLLPRQSDGRTSRQGTLL
jgi:hypothetical protein